MKKKTKEQSIYYKKYLHYGGYMAIKVEAIHHKKHLIEHNVLTIKG
nr:MAG TPA: hypothetical protein [Caudoviricetes sp.]